jgi:hypothetical protein
VPGGFLTNGASKRPRRRLRIGRRGRLGLHVPFGVGCGGNPRGYARG